MRRLAMVVLALGACGGDTTKLEADLQACNGALAEATAAAKPDPEVIQLTKEESVALKGTLEILRKGIVPLSDEEVGLCRVEEGKCVEVLGLEAGVLAEGRYHLFGKLVAPRAEKEGGWKVRLNRSCETESGSSNASEKTWPIQHNPKGYHLNPMVIVKSPASNETKCTYSLSLDTLSGVTTLEGSYTIPKG